MTATATLPLVEQIAKAISSRLEAVDEIAAVVRATRDGQFVDSSGRLYSNVDDGFCVLMQGNSVRDSEGLSMGGKSAWKTDFLLCLFVIPQDNDHVAVDSRTNALVSEAMVGLTTSPDGRPWGRWAGLAIESVFSDITLLQGAEGERSGAVLTLQVQHRHLENNPYTAV